MTTTQVHMGRLDVRVLVLALGAFVGFPGVVVRAQMMEPMAGQAQSSAKQTMQEDDQPQKPDAAQQKASKTFAANPKAVVKPKPVPAMAAALTPLTPRERVVQLLDRFTFGPRPGEVDRVLAQGADNWVNTQMNPGAIGDNYLQKRLADFPTLGMTAEQASTVYPDRAQIDPVAQGKVPYPTDPLLNAVYEVQVYKWSAERDQKKADGTGVPRVELTDAEKAAQHKKDQEEAAKIFGDLFSLPKAQRMAALIQLPVEERIVLTAGGNLAGDQKNLLMADFTPKEREAFNAMSGQVNSSYYIGGELQQGRILRDILSNRQLQAVMTNFWFNHFNIFGPKDSDQWYTTSYERDVIAKNALGNFHDLLVATAESPAMMVYLDNWLSIGPDSLANGVNPQNPNSKKGAKGLNENYGREIMELHTVGVNGGYTQADVTALSAILTGWTVDRPNQAGPFLFDPKRHEPGPKVWFGYVIDDNGTVTKLAPGVQRPATTFGPSNTVATADSMKQGLAALKILADSPQTAHFISYLLAQYFVADNPPAGLVNRLQAVYLSSHGDIKTILRTLIASPEFNSRQYFHNKVKTPEEFVASSFRSTDTDPQNPNALVGQLNTMGMPLYRALPPTGYYLTADQWMNSSALVDRLNFAYQLTNSKFANQKFDAPKLLANGLLTPATAGDLSGLARPAAATTERVPENDKAKLVGVAAKGDMPAGAAVTSPGQTVAMHVLEATMIGAPVSAQTNILINKQLQQQPASATPTDTLNVLTALVMGSPEFQLR
jgi:uncharacterized protein (DUF1800 family)